MKIIKLTIQIILFGILIQTVNAQEKPHKKELTRQEVLNMSYDNLMELPLDSIMMMADIVGVSSLEDLYNIFINKDVLSSSKRKERVFESPLSSSVITSEEIEASGATTVEEALRLVPGVIVREKTNGNFDVHIRGNDNIPYNHMLLYSENSITLVMIDGRPVYNYVHGGTFWESLPVGLNDINRIEVVRGPSSALYGPNAVSGVINIITKNVQGKAINLNGNIQIGNLNTKIAQLSAGKNVSERFGFRISGNYEDRNRSTDEIYVYRDSSFHSAKEYSEMSYMLGGQEYKVLDPNDDVNELFPEIDRSKFRYGLNGYMFFKPTSNINLDFSTGLQNSDIVSSTLGDSPTPYSTRTSNTGYFDLKGDIHGFKPHVSYLTGWQDVVRGDEGFKVDIDQLHANLEYNYQYKDLTLRPGISYMNVSYNDEEYLDSIGSGFLNGKATLSSFAFSLRADYLLFDKLRLTGAVRGEKYNKPDDLYVTYQFVGSYDLNDKNLIRAVVSRANRGPFLVDTYADYFWDRVGRPDPGYIKFNGNKDLDLLTMNMFELGYRTKPAKSIIGDVEIFYTKTKNYGALWPDSVSLFYNINSAPPPVDPLNRPFARMSYQNMDLESEQLGFSASLSWVVSENFLVKLHGTYQQTKMYDVYPYSQEKTLEIMFEDAYMNGLFDLNGDGIPEDITGDGVPDPYPNYYIDTNMDGQPDDLNGDGNPDMLQTTPYSINQPDTLTSELDHKATPSFFGGAAVNYFSDNKKINVFLSSYFYGEQTFVNKYQTVTVDPKVLVNLKISYDFWEGNKLFFNARNILNNKSKEFAFMDDIEGLYMAGIQFNF